MARTVSRTHHKLLVCYSSYIRGYKQARRGYKRLFDLLLFVVFSFFSSALSGVVRGDIWPLRAYEAI